MSSSESIVSSRQMTSQQHEKPRLTVKLRLRNAESTAVKKPSAYSSRVTSNPCLLGPTRPTISPLTPRQRSPNTEESCETHTRRTASQLTAIKEQKSGLQQRLAELDVEENELIQQTFQDKDAKIIGLQKEKSELVWELMDCDSQVARLTKKCQENAQLLQEQGMELERLRIKEIKSAGAKRKLVEFLDDIGFTSEDLVVTTGPIETAIPASDFVPAARTSGLNSIHRDSAETPAKPVLSDTKIPSLRARHSPWTVPDDDESDYGLDQMGETITVRVATKSDAH